SGARRRSQAERDAGRKRRQFVAGALVGRRRPARSRFLIYPFDRACHHLGRHSAWARNDERRALVRRQAFRTVARRSLAARTRLAGPEVDAVSGSARPEMRWELRRAGSRFVSSSISVRRVSRLPCRRRATVEHARNRLGRLGRSLDIAELARSFRAAPASTRDSTSAPRLEAQCDARSRARTQWPP